MNNLLSEVMESIKNLSKWAYVTKSNSDQGQFPTTQVTHNSKTTDVVNLTPYGIYSNLPTGSLVWVTNTGDQEENKIGIGNTPDKRFKGLAEGEVVVGNPLTQVNIKFNKDGDAVVTVPSGNCIINAPDGEVTINSPIVRINGDLLVQGDIIDNYETNTNNMGAMRTIFNTHTHTGDSGGTTDTPNQSQ